MSPAESAAIAAGIPGARLARVPDCGHLPRLEAPGAVTAATRGWLTVDEGWSALPLGGPAAAAT